MGFKVTDQGCYLNYGVRNNIYGSLLQGKISIIDITTSLDKAVGLPMGDTTTNVSVQEDNAGALVLARTFSPEFTTTSKYYAARTIWFCEDIVKRGVNILKIDTIEQLGDLFTKGLPRTAFKYMRKKIMGW